MKFSFIYLLCSFAPLYCLYYYAQKNNVQENKVLSQTKCIDGGFL